MKVVGDKGRNEGEMEMTVDDLVWFDNGSGNEFLTAGTIVEIQDSIAIVHAQGQSHEIEIRHLKKRDETGADGEDNMIKLRDVHEGSVIFNLKKRFYRGIIYTYIGNILCSVNPYKLYNIYSLDILHQYENKLLGKLPPHIFAIGNICYYNMQKDNEDQVIIPRGDSGSGKTELIKLTVNYLANANVMGSSLVIEQILESFSLLQSFGNAKTVVNDNSSRFGKYIEILYENGRISGAVISIFLLEKSRIAYQHPGDRNFHIFYEMLAGLPMEDQEAMGLDKPDLFFYLNQGASSKIVSKNDMQDFQNVIASMEVLGINSEERHGIFCLLSAILHIGNIYFGRTQRNGEEAAVIMNNVEVDFISKLLQVDVVGVAKSLTQKITNAGGEHFRLPFNVEEALDARDALAHALYSRLFTWLVSRINTTCAVKNESIDHLKISLLDIFGFEAYRINGFEQFCINLANEYIHQYFVRHVFIDEQEVYDEERLRIKPIEFHDNSLCLDLIVKPPIGIIHLLSDESTIFQATDRSFLDKCHQYHARNEYYVKPKYGTPEFGINHYAGVVHYQVDMFLQKNRDFVRPEFFELLIYSRSMFIASLFPEFLNNREIHMSQPFGTLDSHRSLTVSEKGKTNRLSSNVISSYNESLQNLLEKISKSSSFFIQCIRPNIDKSPLNFDDALVMSQIQSYGIVETIKWRQIGFPIHMPYASFVKRYFVLCGKPKIILRNPPKENSKKICDQILKTAPERSNEYEMGENKIFLCESFQWYLEEARTQVIKVNVIMVQKHIRGWLKRKTYQCEKDAAVLLQSHIRGFLARKKVARARRGIVKFQSLYRMYKNRKFFIHNKTNELNRISKRQREFLSHVHYADKLEYEKVVDITRFDIPPDLAAVLVRLKHWEPVHLDYNIIAVDKVAPWDYAECTLPGDIDLCQFSKFAKLFFQDNIGITYRKVPLRTSLLKQKYTEIVEAVISFKLIMRFMDDVTMNGLRQIVLGNYIVNKGIRQPELRDEIYSQLVLQTQNNPSEQSLYRGWYLIGLCLCCFPPSSRMNKYLLKYVSDNGYEEHKPFFQRKLLCWDVNSTGRVFPPTLLEWKSLSELSNISLMCEMADGYQQVIEVESSALGENVAKSFLHVRDIADPAVSGWSFYLQFERSCRLDLCGDDTILDLISTLEQPLGFPCSMAHTCISLDRANPMPPGRKEIIIEAHKSYTHRTRLERLRQAYSDELSSQPLVYHQDENNEIPFLASRRASGQDLFFLPDDRFFYKPSTQLPSYFNNENQIRSRYFNQESYLRDPYQRFTDAAYLNNQPNELEEVFMQRVHRKKVPPPPAPPPPPIMPSASHPNSAASSRANTLNKKNIPKPPWDMEEVLQRSNEIKFKRDKSAANGSYELATKNPSSEKSGNYQGKYQGRSVSDIIARNQEIIDLSGDIRANDQTLPRGTKKLQPSILSPLSASLSKSSKNRFANIANRFEHQKGYDRPTSYGTHGSGVSAYVDNIFEPVFADENEEIFQNKKLLNQLKGGGFYPNRIPNEIAYNHNHIYSNVHSTDPQLMLMNQLSQQQQYVQNELFNVKRTENAAQAQNFYEDSNDQFQRNYFPNPSSPPPIGFNKPPQSADTVNVVRRLPFRMPGVVKGIEESYNPEFEAMVNKTFAHRKDWTDSDELTHSVLYPRQNLPYLTYTNTRWKIFLKKEIFFPNEIMNATLKHLIYRQILDDLGSRTCARLSLEDRYKMQRLLAKTMTQESVIFAAKELPLYFSRLYRVNGYAERSFSTFLAVSHSGVRFVTRESVEDELTTTSHLKYNDIIEVKAVNEKVTLDTPDRKIVLHTVKAASIKKLIDVYMKAAEKQEKYVKALGDYVAPNQDHLSFKKGTIIKIYNKKDIEVGMLWGTVGDYRGKFPITLVKDYERVQGENFKLTAEKNLTNKKGGNTSESEPYSMMEFAMRYYSLPEISEAGKLTTLRKNLSVNDDESMWNYINSLVVFGREPLSGSLINFNNKSLSRQAADINKAIMKFMGDIKRDRQETNNELIAMVLRNGIENLDMRDEIYCQLAKQTTNNKSENSESCGRGWKLLMLCTAYFDCSELLRPFLNKFFHSASASSNEFSSAASACELNLSRSFKYGGRKQLPSENELFMFMQGKNSKHQIVELPGGIQKLCKVQTSTTAYDLVKDICQEMGLYSEQEHEEYGVYVFFQEQKLLVPMQDTDYVFDTFAQIEKENLAFTVAFRKVIWYHTMRFANNLFTEVIYNQIVPDVYNGNIIHFKGNRTSHIRDQQTQNEIALLAALQHRISNKHNSPTEEDILSLIPPLISNLLTSMQWLHIVDDHFRLIKHFTVSNARTKYLELISAWVYFGSSFFYIQNCEHPAVDGDGILAINKNGVHILSRYTRDTLLSFSYSEIISTRHLRTDSGRLFVDLKTGNLMVQRVTRLETPRGKEISNMIARYVRCISLDNNKEKD
ncbi:unconventional myosin-XV isoform X6 [Hydra vulgaris]|uniref:Unconventional myosin-XV isoform X6 n=1 Tax=Hydra vulgaris TaxID=6087 RepID=A0ABM4CCH8_HYDVU